nr:HtaA domain-containing protein [Demequina litorisediminis]
MCVADATLTWGFKESFRSYIESTIANGEWTLDGVTEEGGLFTWSAGEAVIDAATTTGTVAFEGAVDFTGHDGALDTTIANPVIELSADGTYLLLDVSGETQAGETVEQTGIRFAEPGPCCRRDHVRGRGGDHHRAARDAHRRRRERVRHLPCGRGARLADRGTDLRGWLHRRPRGRVHRGRRGALRGAQRRGRHHGGRGSR